MGGFGGGSDGELNRMPAEFLIDRDLRIQRAHYYRFGADHLSLDEVFEWAETV